jgi:hypothetical protein
MKQSELNLMGHIEELRRQQACKRDYLTDTRNINLKVMDDTDERGGTRVDMHVDGIGRFDTNDTFHTQMATHLKIPQAYYRRMMQEAPNLFQDNVHHWLHDQPEKRLVRTLDNTGRAFLSDRYSIRDNMDLMDSILGKLSNDNCVVKSCGITDNRMYLKVATPRLEAEVKLNDPVQAGLVISNSEVGLGALRIDFLIYRLACLNGMIVSRNYHGLSRRHVGRRNVIGDHNVEMMLSDNTRREEDKVFWMKVRDMIDTVLNPANFQEIVSMLTQTTQRTIDPTANPEKVVEVAAKRLELTDTERSGVLQHLLSDNEGMTQYGLMNAVTAMSANIESYDRATELEAVGGQVAAMSEAQFNHLVAVPVAA